MATKTGINSIEKRKQRMTELTEKRKKGLNETEREEREKERGRREREGGREEGREGGGGKERERAPVFIIITVFRLQIFSWISDPVS